MDVSGLDYMNWLNSNVSAVEKEMDEKQFSMSTIKNEKEGHEIHHYQGASDVKKGKQFLEMFEKQSKLLSTLTKKDNKTEK